MWKAGFKEEDKGTKSTASCEMCCLKPKPEQIAHTDSNTNAEQTCRHRFTQVHRHIRTHMQRYVDADVNADEGWCMWMQLQR